MRWPSSAFGWRRGWRLRSDDTSAAIRGRKGNRFAYFDYMIRGQLREHFFRHAQSSRQDVAGMFPMQRRRLSIRDGRRREAQRTGDLWHCPCQRMRHVDSHPTCDHLRVGKYLVEAVDGTARNAGGFKRCNPVSLRSRGDAAQRSSAPGSRDSSPAAHWSRIVRRAPIRDAPATSQNRANCPSLPTARIM